MSPIASASGLTPFHGFAELRRDLPDEVGGQERDVLPSLPKGRQVDRDDVQPVVRAGLAERPRESRLLERGGDRKVRPQRRAAGRLAGATFSSSVRPGRVAGTLPGGA